MILTDDLLALGRQQVRRCFGDQDFDLAVVLGSGLSELTASLEGAQSLAYDQIPAMAATTVAGHQGSLWAGRRGGWRLLVFAGRYHLYEGYRACEVVRPVELAAALGCRRILLTNAAGGVREDLRPGDFMFIRDHINLTGDNPLRGRTPPPFVDLSRLYRNDLFPLLAEGARALNIRLRQGVLAGLLGPSYETPAEIRMVASLGGDAVSMSTVPEAIMARYLGVDVAGLSLITNYAAGRGDASLSHDEVLVEGRRSAARLTELLDVLIDSWRLAD
ncbi:purine-nucleoside phosphorylase [Geoalkalibacter ferrihydriticus]|uniref:Purine nucleoside phosphorylase n=1 Tax=Geoalkalibacter ferrihydriticus TaxID=392333 RepID=A0A1G9JYV8_9BACT|nr:purine-nucleoside phosphorylase [Geoalkalibacter ferrihydriticus]SDL42374.1 purine-nucleoside phosphorylase [Geoalkalibacter ferrihydriticus]